MAPAIACEASQKGCTTLLVSNFEQKRGGGGSGLGRFAAATAQAAARYAPVTAGATGAAVRDATYSVASEAQRLASGTRRKDEGRLSYSVITTEGQVLVKKTAPEKAASDGQDILRPLVRTAGEDIATALARNPR